MEWREEYNIGVEVVDKAHKQLFSIVGKMLRLLENSKNDEYACREGMQFFKSYALKHFAEEEAFMKSINYAGLERHRAIHENLRMETLPELEKELEQTRYSHQTVRKVLGVCLGWLTTHVTNEDQSIMGKGTVQLPDLKHGETLSGIQIILTQIIKNTFGLESVPVSSIYSGWGRGPALFQELMCITTEGRKTRVVFALEEELVLSTTGQMLGLRFAQVDETVRAAVRAISHTFMKRVDELLSRRDRYEQVEDRLMTEDEFHSLWVDQEPQFSTLFFTKNGHYACFLDEMQD